MGSFIIKAASSKKAVKNTEDVEVAAAEEDVAAADKNKAEEETAKPMVMAVGAKATKMTKAVREWTIDEVLDFFTEMKLGGYNAAIAENEVDGRMLLDLISQNALADLGIVTTLHVLKIKRRLENT